MEPNTSSASILTRKVGSGPVNPGPGRPSGDRGTGEGSDRRVARKRFTPARIAGAVVALLVILLLVYAVQSSMGGRKLRVPAERLTISTVEIGPFQEYAQVTGNVEPSRTVYLDAVEGGRVEEIYVLEGTQVTVGQPLLALSNNDLQLRLINADAQRMEQINRVQDTQFRMEQNALNLRQQIAEMDYQIQRLQKLYARNQELFEKQLISQQEFDTVADEYNYYLRTKQLTLDGYRADSLRMASQLGQMQASVQRMDANYDVIQRILDNLIVRAPIGGQLTSLNVEFGEIHTPGSRLGQIDELTSFRVRAGVDEFYIARVQAGQSATTLPVAGVEYDMRVTRVYPEVANGEFEVDLEFSGPAPPDIRRGQTIRLRLEMSDSADAMLLPRGGFAQQTGGSWVYVLTSDGEAVRRDVTVGRQNPLFLEVMDGLEPGDRVITSSYASFGDADRLILE
ncbi:MAG: HlyD family efflux transporter periplasmic adaptor subunit [Rhodothermales bacterium]|nr:HlyD family efflux transporter periplasmic adaptor subunit [Rhodothermales bacterium]MBO6780677.1 HlyD family efflux transporter periplasmic adaptor subunit [Rhodothermales bacterium]